MPSPESITILQDWLRKPRLRRQAIGVEMPLYRRRESVTADEVLKILTSKAASHAEGSTSRALVEIAIDKVEKALDEICRNNGIENEDATRRK